MKRSQFLRLCTLAGVAGSTGITSAQESTDSTLEIALKDAGLSQWTMREEGDLLHIRCSVANYEALSRKAASLGDGKTLSKGNILSFTRKGRNVRMELRA
jgi:hypothetical protein